MDMFDEFRARDGALSAEGRSHFLVKHLESTAKIHCTRYLRGAASSNIRNAIPIILACWFFVHLPYCPFSLLALHILPNRPANKLRQHHVKTCLSPHPLAKREETAGCRHENLRHWIPVYIASCS
jgi:hypothetical protein